MISLYWCIRRIIAKKNKDIIRIAIDTSVETYTPLILRIFGYKLFKVFYKSNKRQIERLLIQKNRTSLKPDSLIMTWRIKGDDVKKSPMVLWMIE